jgi:hypothetical protein
MNFTSRRQISAAALSRIETTAHSFGLSGVLAEGRRDERIEARVFSDRCHPHRVGLSECFSSPSLALRVRLSSRLPSASNPERETALNLSRNSRAVRLAELIHAS